MIFDQIAAGFRSRFGRAPSHLYFSPGRVNLIGEYTDFNGGNVLPAAINLGTYFAVHHNESNQLNIVSDAFPDPISLPLKSVDQLEACGQWQDYVVGTVREFSQLGISGTGLDIVVGGNLPRNSGLSSSASFTVGLASVFNEAWGANFERIELVHLARRVENNFIGLQCGIMDQFAVTMGQSGHCIKLHCESLEWSLIPFSGDGYEIVITDSKVPRKLSETSYNQRRAECAGALGKLKAQFGMDTLCAATMDQVESCTALQGSEVELKRARHVVSEDARVDLSAVSLARGNLLRFGELMVASHQSLRDDFDVSCPELDILVEAALDVPGVLGSRMTGAGFGGCTVSLVATDSVPEFISQVSSTYATKTSYRADVISCHADDGVRRID